MTNITNSFAEIVHAEWTAVPTIHAWRHWHRKTVPHLAPMTEALLEAAAIVPGQRVLDIASGSGEPALTIASVVGPDGHVTATDLSHDMIAIAEENRGNCGNIAFQQADVHDLPFADNSFDAVTCRLGVMYFWNCRQALSEILRVLKPGGRAVFIAWGDLERNTLARTVMMPFAKRRQPPPLPAGAPHPFRFAEPGSLAGELERAGFAGIQEEQKKVRCPWPGSPEELWRQVYDMAVPLQAFFDAFEPAERNAAVNEVIAEFSQFHDGEYTDPGTFIVVAAGMKAVMN